MKLIIDIPDEVYSDITSLAKFPTYITPILRDIIKDGTPYEERPQGDLISREALKKALHNFFDGKVIDEPTYILCDVLCHIDSAPTVSDRYGEGYSQGYIDGSTGADWKGEE